MEIKDAQKKYGLDLSFTCELKGSMNGKSVTQIKRLKWERFVHVIKYTFSAKYRESFASALTTYNKEHAPALKKVSSIVQAASIILPIVNENENKIKNLENEVLNLETQLAAAEASLRTNSETVEAVTRRIAELEQPITSLTAEISQQEEEIKRFDEEDIKKLLKPTHKETLKSLQKAHDEKFLWVARQGGQEAIDAKRAKLKQLIALLNVSSLEERKNDLQRTQKELETAKQDLETYRSNNPLEENRSAIQTCEEEILSLQQQIASKKQEIQTLKGEPITPQEPEKREAEPEIEAAAPVEAPVEVSKVVSLNENSINFLNKIQEKLGEQARALWEVLLTRFANEYGADCMTSYQEKNNTVKLNFSQPLQMWLLSFDNGVEDPIGGIITMLGSNRFRDDPENHEVVIKLNEGEMVFESGYESFSPFPKKFAGLASKLNMTTTDATIHSFVVDDPKKPKTFTIEGRKKIAVFNKKAEKVKTFEELQESWSSGGEVLKPDVNIVDYLNNKIVERKAVNNQSQ